MFKRALLALPLVYFLINALVLLVQGAPLTAFGSLAIAVGYMGMVLRHAEIITIATAIVLLTGVLAAFTGEPASLVDKQSTYIDQTSSALTRLPKGDYQGLDTQVAAACSLAPLDDIGSAAVSAIKAVLFNLVLSAADMVYQTWFAPPARDYCREAVDRLVTTYPETRHYFSGYYKNNH